ncbi:MULTISPECIES: IclR family transcriptional regulator domain-containing protein [Microbaculum]|uniref:Helix-turn-helix domain-containing protein n=1 Tax=Microbaculum marinisediminis TaxID=2931392 RepID=A0AAW5R1V0_9HYPH|nr:IclR family transcriptional regulator C-terminal domain-containing protein [Microbaculum sp. A6E488]MCT8973953.1 helix-turn-helix domain-containing protein [Microbaculum sp. A6E488]
MSRPYKDVRSLARGLQIIEALGELGWTSPQILSKAVGIDRTTVYRLLSTLADQGYVVRREEDGAVSLTSKLSQIADGIKTNDLHAQIAAPYIRELTSEILWPSDFASFILGEVVIRYSTHKISPMSIHHAMIGKSRLLLRSALGKAIISAMTERELEAIRAIVCTTGGQDAEDLRSESFVRRTIEKVRRDGFASSVGESERKISAIARPVLSSNGHVLGALNLVYFTTVMTPEEAARRYMEPFSACIGAIEKAIAAERAALAGT